MRRMLRAEAGPFSTLFLLELRRNWARLVVTAVVYVMLMATFFPDLGDRELVKGAYLLAASWASFLLSLAAILFAFLAVQDEWRGQTHYLLLSLPVRGWVVLGAKMLAVCVQLALLLLLANGVLWAAREWAHWRGTGGFLLERMAGPGRLTWIDAASEVLGVAALFEQLPLSAAGFLAYVLSRPFRRLYWLLAGLAYFGIVYVAMTRGGLYPLTLFSLVVCKVGRRLPLCTDPFYYQSLIASMILLSAGVLWLAGVLWDRKVEV